MFDTAFGHIAPAELRLCPADIAARIDALCPECTWQRWLGPPDGPQPFGKGPGRQGFPGKGMTGKGVPARLIPAMPGFPAVTDAFGDPQDSVPAGFFRGGGHGAACAGRRADGQGGLRP